jgi:hypothetical protein
MTDDLNEETRMTITPSAPQTPNVSTATPSSVGKAPDGKKASPDSSPPPAAGTVPKDSVHLTAAAQSAVSEATETHAQTTKEARQGDIQAKHLLAKQAAAKAAAEPPVHVIA